MSGILQRSQGELGSRDDMRLRLRSNTCERNIDDMKGEGRDPRVFIPEARIEKCVKSRLGTEKRSLE